MIVTIDGPAGAGKSSAARALARRLNFRFLDTGALYRAVAWAACDRGLDLQDAAALERLAEQLRVELRDQRVTVDGQDVTQAIRRPEVTQAIHYVADNPRIRQRMVQWQRRLAAGDDVVTEGRDQGTVAFPDAACKIFLTASREERARRRFQELRQRDPEGGPESWDEVLRQQDERDRRDRERPVGALRPAEDAVVVQTDGLTAQQVVDHLESLVRQRAGHGSAGKEGTVRE